MAEASRVRRVRGIALALALIYSVLIFWGVGEAATRVFGLLDRLTGVPRNLYVSLHNDDLPYRLNAGVQVETGAGPVVVNSLGLRGVEVAPKPAAAVDRILVLGDSIVFGQGVGEQDTFPGSARA